MNDNRLKGMKNFSLGVYTEIFEWNQYDRYVKVEAGDVVLDLGCSLGYFYFKNNELGIDYIGVDGSIDHLKDFIDNLNGGDELENINKKDIILEVINKQNEKIDFLIKQNEILKKDNDILKNQIILFNNGSKNIKNTIIDFQVC